MAGDVIVRVDGDGNSVTVLCDREQAALLREQQQAQANRQAAERSWARANPYRYAEGGTEAFEAADARRSAVFVGWLAIPVLGAIGWGFSTIALPGGFLTNLITLVLGAALIGAVVAVPAGVLVAIPALIHAVVLEHRDERAARIRAATREHAQRLAAETVDNDRRLSELGIEI